MIFCEECGAKLEDGAKFCEECGAVLEPLMGVDASELKLSEEADVVVNKDETLGRRSKRPKIIVTACLVLCVICLGGIVLLGTFLKKGSMEREREQLQMAQNSESPCTETESEALIGSETGEETIKNDMISGIYESDSNAGPPHGKLSILIYTDPSSYPVVGNIEGYLGDYKICGEIRLIEDNMYILSTEEYTVKLRFFTRGNGKKYIQPLFNEKNQNELVWEEEYHALNLSDDAKNEKNDLRTGRYVPSDGTYGELSINVYSSYELHDSWPKIGIVTGEYGTSRFEGELLLKTSNTYHLPCGGLTIVFIYYEVNGESHVQLFYDDEYQNDFVMVESK